MTAIRYEKDQDAIVTLTMDMPNQSANTMNADFRVAFGDAVNALIAEKEQITGVILASAKKNVFRRRGSS
jgi:3-hydroxyacyl-CoA dehydrogenase/enoyl-CoA hydratase/3-hydroxybutyryl-CoA epimerase